jgi:hypothetical protein
MDNIAYIVKSSMADFYLSDSKYGLWTNEISEAQLFSKKTLEEYKSKRGEHLDTFLTVKITIV